jgi:predicted secreted Zn-dependent protease
MGTTRTHGPARDHARRLDAGRAPRGCAPELEVAANPATIQALLRGADTGTRERLASSLQRRHGNAAVQRLLAPMGGLPVQRWAVGLPRATADCARVVSYLDANSPHRADSGWAKTRASFSWGGSPAYTETDGVITATVTSPTVRKTVSVDMPQWSPTSPAMSQAWSSMSATLRAHEAVHEGIASEWETTLTSRLASLSVTVANRNIASFNAAVQAEWNAWIAEHQAAQTAIDPFTAVLDCSGGEPETTTTTPGADGETAAPGDG